MKKLVIVLFVLTASAFFVSGCDLAKPKNPVHHAQPIAQAEDPQQAEIPQNLPQEPTNDVNSTVLPKVAENVEGQGTAWIYQSPQEAGFDSAGLRRLDDYMRQNTGTTGLVIAVNGKIIHTYGNITELSYLASCRKSVLSMLYGIYVANGTISLDETIGQIGITDVQELLPIELTAKVRDLISSRSGVYHPASNAGGIPTGKEPPRGKTKPGTRFLYNNWDFNAAGTIFEKKTGLGIYEALHKDIAVPIGMEDFDLSKQRLGGNRAISEHRAYHIHLSTRDMARLGQLMLNHGKWGEKQILPERWVDVSTSIISPVTGSQMRAGYGYMWWVLRPNILGGGYQASGAHGQWITVFPKLNMVVAHKSSGNASKPTSDRQYMEILNLILKSRINR